MFVYCPCLPGFILINVIPEILAKEVSSNEKYVWLMGRLSSEQKQALEKVWSYKNVLMATM